MYQGRDHWHARCTALVKCTAMERAMDKFKGSWIQVKEELRERFDALSVSDVLHVEDELYAQLRLGRIKALDEAEDILGRLAFAEIPGASPVRNTRVRRG